MIIIKQKNTKIFIPTITLIVVLTVIAMIAIVNTHTKSSGQTQTTQTASQAITDMATMQGKATHPTRQNKTPYKTEQATTVIETTSPMTEKITTSVAEPATNKPKHTKQQTQANNKPAQTATKKPKQTKTRPQGPYGTWGRLFIPSVDIDVALYQTPCTPDAQPIVDAYDSAAYINTLDGAVLIADHSNQGFDKIANLKAGDKLYIYRPDDSIETYVCQETCNGKNYTSKICDERGVASVQSSGIWCYTCGASSVDIIISKFQKE